VTGELFDLGLAAALYFAVVLVLGTLATRRSSRSPEEYFLAGRGLGTLVLFMALFGTNCTTFVLVGIPGQAFEHGIGVFGLNAAVLALGIPLSFWAIGSPARRMAQRLGALTPAELYARRFGSRAVGLVLFAAFTVYTIPYMVQAVIGAGLTLEAASGGRLSQGLAGALVLVVALVYTSLGGMRATAWTNVFQGALFLAFLVAAFFLVSRSLGGLEAATAAVAGRRPELLAMQDDWLFEPRAFASWGIVISLTVIGFPHMFARLMAAKEDETLRRVCRLYPLALVALWVPAVLLGFWGAGAFPDLEEPDKIFQRMSAAHMPEALSTFSLLAVLAVVMSTLDAQILTLSSMLVRDVLAPSRGESAGAGRGEPARRDVAAGRWFAVAIAGLVYVLATIWSRESVFDISRKAFEGYTTVVPALFLGVRWRRFTAAGALASIAAGNAVLVLGWSWPGLPTLGFLPVFWAFVAAILAGVGASLASRTAPERTLAAFGPEPGVSAQSSSSLSRK